MRRNSRGRRGGSSKNIRSNRRGNIQSVNNSALSELASGSDAGSGSSRASANQLPIVIPINSDKNTWKLYFPTEEKPSSDEVIRHIKCFQNFIDKYRSIFDLDKINQTHSVSLVISNILTDPDMTTNWPTFKEDLHDKPEMILPLLEYCLHEKFNCEYKIKLRIISNQPPTPFKDLKLSYFGKLVTIEGTATRISCTGLVCTSMAFECSNCQNVQAILQPQGIFTAPNICPNCRRSNKFQPLQSSPHTVTTDSQIVIVEELDYQSALGAVPQGIEVELLGDLVGCIRPSDNVSITGIVQVRQETKNGEDGKKAARLLLLYVEAVSIQNYRNLSNPTVSFTLQDYYAIQEIHDYKNVFRLLVHSLCPSIFGHELVKAGLLLGLFGGTERDDGTRSNPHILMVGDPGLGKSQLLHAVYNASSKGISVGGPAATSVGLTVGLGRVGRDTTMEAGALVLADRGVCCIDELDKMSCQHNSLLEAMEQQRVSIARGGLVCSMAARATIVAAANPAAGSYNRAKTVAENLKINSALLSRFDLVFILMDVPNEKMDAMLSEHILALNTENRQKTRRNNRNEQQTIANSESNEIDPEVTLSQRLQLEPGEYIDVLPMVLLRKYIAYARRYVHPKLSVEAANTLQNFYLELRQNHGVCYDGTPITTRQLEACVRLTQARAKAELREEATGEDAQDVISLMRHSLIDTFSDEFGNIQLSRTERSKPGGKNKVKRFVDALTRASEELSKDVFTRQELIQIHKAADIAGEPNDLIELMHVNSYFLLKASNTYQFLGTYM